MIQKIKQWWKLHRVQRVFPEAKLNQEQPETYTREQLEKAFQLGYNDGRRDGLAIAREQATKSLKEILWQSNDMAEFKRRK